jgi:tetratricopeptide (TPR) repeat protein
MNRILLSDPFRTNRAAVLTAALMIFAVATFSLAAADSPVPASSAKTDDLGSQELRSYLQVQEQLHATQLVIEHNRQESEAAAQRNNDLLTSHLQTIEQTLTSQHNRELEAMQSSNRALLMATGAFAGVGLAALLLMSFLQWRTVNRLAHYATLLPRLQQEALQEGGIGDFPRLTSGSTESPSPKLLEALEAVEQRLIQLEHATGPALKSPSQSSNGAAPSPHANGASGNGHSVGTVSPQPNPILSASDLRLLQMLAQGQALLDAHNPKSALDCFEQALTLAPGHAEALVKKGIALEKLQKPAEAVECFDKAVAADGSLTMAYLHKGGLFNRMGRFSEALKCYELALQTQEKRHPRAQAR